MKPKLLFHSQGKAVAELQSKLNHLLPDKLPALVVDGIFGEKTHHRVKDFQAKLALVVDGVVGAKTWAALDGSKPPPGPPKQTAPTIVHKVKWTPVMNGAFLRCSYGMVPSTLAIAPHTRPATVRDCQAGANIRPFGMCQSMLNPSVAAATQASQGVFVPQPCNPVPVSQWSAVQPIQLIPPDQTPAIDVGSMVMCAWGGQITVS
jgi:hypothetical protein